MGESNGKKVYKNIGKMVPVQLPNGKDLITSLKKACQDNGIRYAAILSTVGSLGQLKLENIIVSQKPGAGTALGPPKIIPGPMQVMSLEGFIYDSAEGEMDYHIHGLFVDTGGKIFGGHLIEGGNPVQNRLVMLIGEIAGVRMVERLDEASGHLLMNFEPLP